MAVFYTGDIHFSDDRIMKLCDRPFLNTQEMDDFIVRKWNDKVSENDTVYVIGDIVSDEHFDATTINKLNGQIYLVFGNHDYPLKDVLLDTTKLKCNVNLLYRNDCVDMGRKIIMFHFPIMDWDGINEGSVMLYGHVHNKNIKEIERYYENKLGFNVCMDVNDFEPKTLEELIKNSGKDKLFKFFQGGNL